MKLTKELWKEEQAARKAELKEIAKEIKTLKPIFKDSQRNLTRTQQHYNLERNVSHRSAKYDSSIISMVKDIYIKALYQMWEHQTRLRKLRSDFRILHLEYCLYNGTPLDKIEPNHRDDYYWNCIRQSPSIKKAMMYQINWEVQKELELDRVIAALTEEQIAV